MNRKEASRQETRRLILEAAHKLFSQKKAEECTLRDIAREAGVSPASLIVHFKSKTALIDAALSSDLEELLSAIPASMPREGELLDRLMHPARKFLGFYASNRDLYRTLVRNSVFESVSETPHMTSQSERYVRWLATIIDEERSQGSVRPEIDPIIAAAAVFSLYLGALTVLFRMSEMDVDFIAQGLSTMTGQYLRGIMG